MGEKKISALDLCSKGFLPKELPPCFSVTSFNQAALDELKGIEAITSRFARYNMARPGTLRRRLGIPNPINHAKLACHIEQYWPDIMRVLDASCLSCSKPVATDSVERAFESEPQSDRVFHRARICSCSRYLVKADISRFYHSIYTHSIYWAAHSKPEGKTKTPKERRGDWGELLDIMYRDMNDRQTIGIPIGPDSSQIIAELLLCNIDAALQESHPSLNGFRFIDDYEFGIATRSEAEKLLSDLQNELSVFELELNPLKTAIIELPVPLMEPWVHILSQPLGSADKRSVVELFDRAFIQQKRFPNDGVLRYALRVLADLINAGANDIFELSEQIVCQCAMVEPSTIRYGVHILEKLYLAGHEFRYFFKTVEMILDDAAQKGHDAEMCWVLYALLRFQGQCSDANLVNYARHATVSDNPFVLLLAAQLRMADVDADCDEIDNKISQCIESENLNSAMWPLIYELGIRIYPDAISKSEGYSILNRHGIRYFEYVEECRDVQVDLPNENEDYRRERNVLN